MSESDPIAPPLAFDDRPGNWYRRKGNIGPVGLTVLGILAFFPLVMTLSRILALPGGANLPFGLLDPLASFGEFLNQRFTLQWVPPSDRSSILYLLLLPTGALVISITRLTLGVRVLGLRAILIAMGFQRTGFLPSLLLMGIVIGTISVVRPWTRRVKLPLYARIAVVLTMSTIIMVGALLVAPSLKSEAVWSMAFFPVIIMALLAEGIAKTLERDNIATAIWRAGWTIVLAVLIAIIDTGVSHLTYQFPELMLTQLVCVVFVAEFFDLRLLESWPDRLDRYFSGVRPWYRRKPKIAVVRNRRSKDVLSNLGRPAPKRYTKLRIQRHVDALREQGFQVKVFEGDLSLPKELKKYLPPRPRDGAPSGIVFNLATGVQGAGRFAQIPALLEIAGLPYTGPDPQGHALLNDRFALVTTLRDSGVPVPRHAHLEDAAAAADLSYPLALRPRFEADASRTVVRNRRSLRTALQGIRADYGQSAMAEEIVRGREFRVSILGNDVPRCLPILEYGSGEQRKVCPAPLEEDLARKIRECALRAYRVARCRDYARIDIRLSPLEDPVVVDVHWANLFAKKGSFVTAAKAAGYELGTLLHAIIGEAAKRYVPKPSDDAEPGSESRVVSLADRRAATG